MQKIVMAFLLLTSCTVYAQTTVMSFSKEQAVFVKDLSYFMTLNKNEQNIVTMNAFEKMVKEAKIPAAWFEQMSKTCNTMAERNMAALAHYNPYVEAVMAAAKVGLSDGQFTSWTTFVNDIIDAQKKGDNGPFLKTMDFSESFFAKGALNSTLAKTWKTDPRDCKFNSEGLRPFVSFTTTNLIGTIKDDSVRISNTSGSYYPLETKWEGKGGRVDWGRAGLDASKVYCTVRNYEVNCNNFGYSADTVTFYYTEYFKTPLTGKLIDKLSSGADSAGISYPRFESYEMGITVKDIAPNVSYVGGFSLHGAKVLGYGNTEVEPMLNFYARGGTKKIMTVRSNSISIKRGEELGATKAEITIYFGSDSIYHPQLNMVYKAAKREVRLLRGETGLGKAKFTDSYHNQDFQTDAIYWNLDSSILNLRILSGVGEKPGVYESVNYFNKELLRKTQGYTNYEPLNILKKLAEKGGSRDLNSIDVARAIDPNLKEGEVKSLFYELIENGFILYNEELGIVTVKDKTINYVLANAKKIDYDIIHIKSLPKKGNDFIDINNNNIDLKGVFEVPISDTAYVYFRPKNNAISLLKDRNMEFDGLIYAGRTDLTGKEYKFNYKPFTVDLTKVDTMVLYIPDSLNSLDKEGNPVLVQMKSRIENITGLLEIDAPINKSGRTRLLQFPKLHSKEKSNIFYDDPAIAKGAYNRKNFSFELLPFRLDSMGVFSPGMVNWPGTLKSADIFPEIENRISIQKDLSLGFKGEAPPNGYPLYKDKGMYYGKYELNYSGLLGDGRITHSTADFTSHDIHLYPDSLRGSTDTFKIAKTFDGVKTPAVVGTSDMVFWKPYSDTMYVSMLNKDQPFAMYDDGFTTFKGNLMLTGSGLGGDGTLDWNEATLSSNNFSFRTMALSADTASLNIKTTGDKITFKTPNVSAKVDFETRIGHFISNEKNIPTEFSWNKYTTAINEFKWFMDEKILDFKAPPDGPGEYFTSTKPDQKGLKFLGKRAVYSLVTSLLRIEQVPEIRVADASVIPDSGIVIIEEDAKMNQLRNATIIADTIHKYHKIEKAVVDIYSKNELKAIGEYRYNTKEVEEIISFTDISCKREIEGKNKKEKEFYLLTAKANLDEQKNFVIYPDVHFNGEANLLSVNRFLNFKGYAKIGLNHPKAATTDFFINQDVNPDTLWLKYDTTAKSSTGNKLTAGIHLNPSPDAPAMYSTLLSPKQEAKDITLFSSTGAITQTASGEYLFGDSAKIKDNSVAGNLLRFDDKKGIVKADGKFNFGTNFGIIKTLAAGSAEAKLDSSKYKFNLTFGIDLKMEDKMQERFDFYMIGDNADQPDISYEDAKQKSAIRNLSDVKDDKKLLEEFDKTAAFIKRPKDLYHNLVFNDVTFVYDADDISIRSIGKIGLAMSGKKIINKKLEGYIEYQYKGGVDIFTIYLETGTKGWFFFEYRPGQLGIVSSYDDINNGIAAVAPDKRRIKGDNNRFYTYTLGSTLNKEDFIQYMKDKAAGVVRVRPEPRVELPPIIEDTIMLDSSGQIIPAPDEKIKIQQQQDINELEKMKMNNESILSGPPPDRKKSKKKKEQEETPAEEQPVTPEMIQQERERQQEMQQMEQMRQEGGGIFSAPPPGREQPKEEPVQEVPKVEIIEPIAEPVQEVPKEEVKPVEEVKPEPPKETPVQETPKVEPIPEAPKEEAKPVEEVKPEPPKEEPVQEAPKAEPIPEAPKEEVKPIEEVKPEPPKEEPVQQTPKVEPVPETPKEEVKPVEEVKPEPPKEELIQQTPQQDVPKADTIPVIQQITPEGFKTDSIPR